MYLSVGIIILASASCKTDSGRKEYSSVLVKTLTVGNRDSVEYVKYPGVINSEKEVTIAFKVNGQIAFLPENEGMSFRLFEYSFCSIILDFKIMLVQCCYNTAFTETHSFIFW